MIIDQYLKVLLIMSQYWSLATLVVELLEKLKDQGIRTNRIVNKMSISQQGMEATL